MSGNNQAAKAKAEIRDLSSRIKELEKKLQAANQALVAAEQPEAKESRISRSTLEAYVGLGIAIVLAVWPMTWWLRIPMFLVLCLVCADFCWRSPFTHKSSIGVKVILEAVFLSWMIWAAYGNIHKAYLDEKFPSNVAYLTAWGGVTTPPTYTEFADENGKGGRIYGEAASQVTVDGSTVERYSKDYLLWAVCFHISGYVDKDDVPISGSSLFDIQNGAQTTIKIPWSEQFQSEVIHRMTGTNYALILIPKKIRTESFSSVRSALDKGGIVLQRASGPP